MHLQSIGTYKNLDLIEAATFTNTGIQTSLHDLNYIIIFINQIVSEVLTYNTVVSK